MSKLPIYKFYNGIVERKASVCNLYDILRKLGICKATGDAICWVRDYTHGCVIKTQEQLDALVLNSPERLRISFFSTPLTIADLVMMADNHLFPAVNGGPPTGIDVYTLWFDTTKLRISKSGVQNVDLLFGELQTAYMLEYNFKDDHTDMEEELKEGNAGKDTKDTKDKKDTKEASVIEKPKADTKEDMKPDMNNITDEVDELESDLKKSRTHLASVDVGSLRRVGWIL